jgi:transient receptor potential cation channel subfamily C member 4
MVRKSTVHRNPIGSTSEAVERQRTRQSLRRHIMDTSSAGLTMNTETLLEFNPKLADVSHTTRIAYAKFMTTKIKKEIKFEDEKVTNENEKVVRAREAKAFNKFRVNAGILKKAREISAEDAKTNNAVSIVEPSTSSASDDISKDFRARTPIQEDPNEDIQTPDRPSTPENILDEPVPQISSSPISATASPVSTTVTSPTPCASPVPSEGRKPDSPLVKTKSLSSTPGSPAVKGKALEKTDESIDEDDDDEEDKKVPEKARKSSTASKLNVPPPASRPTTPTISLSTGDKGKSKITGKTLTGWI